MHTRLALHLLVCVLALSAVRAQWVGLPPALDLTAEGHALIVSFETGGQHQYERWPHPEWPGAASGVTVGIGYDCGYNAGSVIRSDWRSLGADAARLAQTSGLRGVGAKPAARELRDILIAWDLALGVFDRVTVARFTELARRTYPGFDDLRPNAQAALVSLTFNRGSDMIGDRRYELRQIRTAVTKRDYAAMAEWNRRSIRVWRGTSIYAGMARRREAEAELMLTP
ncbi:MAG: hypothetical protein ACFUZC_16660 [Chthoniobacteraceae bacterium]